MAGLCRSAERARAPHGAYPPHESRFASRSRTGIAHGLREHIGTSGTQAGRNRTHSESACRPGEGRYAPRSGRGRALVPGRACRARAAADATAHLSPAVRARASAAAITHVGHLSPAVRARASAAAIAHVAHLLPGVRAADRELRVTLKALAPGRRLVVASWRVETMVDAHAPAGRRSSVRGSGSSRARRGPRSPRRAPRRRAADAAGDTPPAPSAT